MDVSPRAAYPLDLSAAPTSKNQESEHFVTCAPRLQASRLPSSVTGARARSPWGPRSSADTAAISSNPRCAGPVTTTSLATLVWISRPSHLFNAAGALRQGPPKEDGARWLPERLVQTAEHIPVAAEPDDAVDVEEIWGDELAAIRLQKLEQQRQLLEKKQRRKRQVPLMVQANPDALQWQRHQRPRRREERSEGLKNPFLQEHVPEAHLDSRDLRAVGTAVCCGGDSHGERGTLAFLPQAEDCAEDQSEFLEIHDEPEVFSQGSSPGMDGDGERGDVAAFKEEDPKEKEEASRAAATSPATECQGSAGGGGARGRAQREATSPPLALGPGLGEDMEAFVLTPAAKGYTVQCRISRNKRGLGQGVFPLYYLYLEAAYGRKHFLLAGRKRKWSKTSNYLISLDPTDLSRDGDNFVGKLRSNVLGTKFTIFNKGVNPERKHLDLETAKIREELGVVCYEPNILGYKGPRKMTVIIPEINSENERISIQPQNEEESILSRFQRGAMEGLVLLQNKAPLWSEENGNYVLNFHDRVTRASIKNFQIVYPNKPHYLVLQFGRVAAETFTMDFCFPLCPLQAFAICLSSFDGKLACE
ncbi:tubby-related protein 2 [Ctenodactylus gundi]